MNMNQVINMAMRIIMRKGINAGINQGMNMFRGRGSTQNNPPADNQDQISPSQDDDRSV